VPTLAHYQYVWDPRYIDAPILRDEDMTGNGDCVDPAGFERLYYTQDANFNVTAIVQGTPGSGSLGTVEERYVYDAYGRPSFLDLNFANSQGTSRKSNPILYCGYRYDNESGLFNVRHRMYDTTLGRCLQRDPLGASVGPNLYEYCKGSPASWKDPSGLDSADKSSDCDRLVQEYAFALQALNLLNKYYDRMSRLVSSQEDWLKDNGVRSTLAKFEQTVAEAAASVRGAERRAAGAREAAEEASRKVEHYKTYWAGMMADDQKRLSHEDGKLKSPTDYEEDLAVANGHLAEAASQIALAEIAAEKTWANYNDLRGQADKVTADYNVLAKKLEGVRRAFQTIESAKAEEAKARIMAKGFLDDIKALEDKWGQCKCLDKYKNFETMGIATTTLHDVSRRGYFDWQVYGH
jgi:RHS repeat-associated protein